METGAASVRVARTQVYEEKGRLAAPRLGHESQRRPPSGKKRANRRSLAGAAPRAIGRRESPNAEGIVGHDSAGSLCYKFTMRNLRTRFAVAVALIVLAFMAIPQTRHVASAVLRAAGIERGPHALQTGDQLTALNLSSLNGTPVTLANTGRPQIINVFATWCTPCKAETPGLARAAASLRASGVELIGIDQSESGPVVARFAHENDLQYPIYVDADGSVTHRVLGARFIPTTIVVDRHGVIRFEHSGPLSQADFSALAAAVRSAG